MGITVISKHQVFEAKPACSKIESESYILVRCADDCVSQDNVLVLRDSESNSAIALRPGWNLLTVEDYPDLRNGFRPRKTATRYVYNDTCQAVLEVDMSHFDCSAIKSTAFMFCCMKSLLKIDLSNVSFSNVESMTGMFLRCQSLKHITGTSPYTFHSPVLRNASRMFVYTALPSLALPFFAKKGVELNDIFSESGKLHDIDLSGWDLRSTSVSDSENGLSIFTGCERLKKVYAVGCSSQTVKKIQAALNCASLFNTAIIQ